MEAVETKATSSEDDEVVLSLEDEDTLTPEVEPVKKTVETLPEEDDVLEAEILDAEIMVEQTPTKEVTKVVKPLDAGTKPATLLDIVKRPQVAAALMTLILVGAGGYYWVNNQLDPFTCLLYTSPSPRDS